MIFRRAPIEHDLKISPKWFELVASGRKTCEVRFDDRNYRTGDVLRIAEWRPALGYTGRTIDVDVTHVLRDVGMAPGYVALSIARRNP